MSIPTKKFNGKEFVRVGEYDKKHAKDIKDGYKRRGRKVRMIKTGRKYSVYINV